MKIRRKWFGSIVGVVASLAVCSTAMASLPPENPLPDWLGYGIGTVDFTDIAINYKNGKKKKGIIEDSVFFAESTATSTFNLNDKDGNLTAFNGHLIVDAKLSSRGRLRTGETDNGDKISSFGIYSNDAMFGTGHTTTYDCNKSGNNCSTGQLVYGGALTAFGWSSENGILEFIISNLSGWALDEWTTGDQSARNEHLKLTVQSGSFDLGGVSSVKAFEDIADGFAVVPVPAAAWLFGSGLIGLVGLARHKRS